MTGADCVALKFMLYYPRVLTLKMFGNCVAKIWILLVSVYSSQEKFFAVEIKSVCTELSGAETENSLGAKGGVTAFAGAYFPAVKIHFGDMRGAVKLQKQTFSLHFGRNFQLSAAAAYHLIIRSVGIVQRRFFYGVWYTHRLRFSAA